MVLASELHRGQTQGSTDNVIGKYYRSFRDLTRPQHTHSQFTDHKSFWLRRCGREYDCMPLPIDPMPEAILALRQQNVSAQDVLVQQNLTGSADDKRMVGRATRIPVMRAQGCARHNRQEQAFPTT